MAKKELAIWAEKAILAPSSESFLFSGAGESSVEPCSVMI
jgi:hypothetical protein